ISLLAQDALTGATQISFFAPDDTSAYTVYNVTGEKVTELYLVDSYTGEQGENYAAEGLDDGASLVIEMTTKADKTGKNSSSMPRPSRRKAAMKVSSRPCISRPFRSPCWRRTH
ncbi:MAG: hypothetical protein IJ246_05375, partial [Clostridia bacterium]|nr:hypothetical protein [Clostridia bacterium]